MKLIVLNLTREEVKEAIESYWVRRKTGRNLAVKKVTFRMGFGNDEFECNCYLEDVDGEVAA